MNGIAALPAWATVIVAALLFIGASIILIGALGLLRLRTFYQRIHGPAITITLGAGCILLASMVYFTVSQSRLVVHEVIITGFLLMTAPVVSMLIMRAAVYRDLRAREGDAGATAGGVYTIVEGESADSPAPGKE
jgi:multicomponent K+:H+ antiporter subunit G